MRLCQFRTTGEYRLGVLVNDEYVADLQKGYKAIIETKGYKIGESHTLPTEMINFLLLGESGMLKAVQVKNTIHKYLTANKPIPHYVHSVSKVKLGPPVLKPRKVICVGMNYRDHCKESGKEIPKTPVIFAKFPTAITGMDDPILLPKVSKQVDYEAELAFIIGKEGKNIPKSKAYDYVAGYTVFNDVSARDLQFGDGQWVRGKTPDTFAPIGPYLVTKDEVSNPHKLRISLTLNGKTMQDSNTNQIIFKVDYLVSFLSQVMTLEVGDIVSTGTPPGVGIFRKPPVLLKPKDVVEITIEKLGTLRNPVAKGK